MRGGLVFGVVLLIGIFAMDFASAFIVNHTNIDQFYSLTQEQTDRVRELSFVFGHQSVGGGIFGGLCYWRDQDSKYWIDLAPGNVCTTWIADVTRNDYLSDSTIFGSLAIGAGNFEEMFEFWNANYDLIDVGMMKFCYVNFYSWGEFKTAEEGLNYYNGMVNNFKTLHPDAIMIHFTLPLRNEDFSSDPDGYQRSRYRDLILQEYGSNPNEYVFDIADIESWYGGSYATTSNGTSNYLIYNNAYYIPGDCCHLNFLGEQTVARGLWVMLAKVAEDLAGVTPPAVDTDVNDDGKTNVIDAALISFWQGKDSGDADWSSYSHLDVDKDYDIDFRDVVEAVKKIL